MRLDLQPQESDSPTKLRWPWLRVAGVALVVLWAICFLIQALHFHFWDEFADTGKWVSRIGLTAIFCFGAMIQTVAWAKARPAGWRGWTPPWRALVAIAGLTSIAMIFLNGSHEPNPPISALALFIIFALTAPIIAGWEAVFGELSAPSASN